MIHPILPMGGIALVTPSTSGGLVLYLFQQGMGTHAFFDHVTCSTKNHLGLVTFLLRVKGKTLTLSS